MPDAENFKERNQEIWETWVGGIIASCIGLASVGIGSFGDGLETLGRIMLILFGAFLQIPLGYFKIYKLIVGED